MIAGSDWSILIIVLEFLSEHYCAGAGFVVQCGCNKSPNQNAVDGEGGQIVGTMEMPRGVNSTLREISFASTLTVDIRADETSSQADTSEII